MVVGLIIAVLIGFFVRDPLRYAPFLRACLLLAAQGASVGLTGRAELASLFFARQGRRQHRLSAVLLDTSSSSTAASSTSPDRLCRHAPWSSSARCCESSKMVADSADATRRRRGRRGLDVLTDMQKDASINLLSRRTRRFGNRDRPRHLVRTAKRIDLGRS